MAKDRTIRVDTGGIHKAAKRFALPPGYSVREFVMRQLDGNDDIEIAGWLQVKLAPEEKKDEDRVQSARAMERVRRSLVTVDGEQVNLGHPYEELDEWSQPTITFALSAFSKLHVVPQEQIDAFLAAAEDVQLLPRAGRMERTSDSESTDD